MQYDDIGIHTSQQHNLPTQRDLEVAQAHPRPPITSAKPHVCVPPSCHPHGAGKDGHTDMRLCISDGRSGIGQCYSSVTLSATFAPWLLRTLPSLGHSELCWQDNSFDNAPFLMISSCTADVLLRSCCHTRLMSLLCKEQAVLGQCCRHVISSCAHSPHNKDISGAT